MYTDAWSVSASTHIENQCAPPADAAVPSLVSPGGWCTAVPHPTAAACVGRPHISSRCWGLSSRVRCFGGGYRAGKRPVAACGCIPGCPADQPLAVASWPCVTEFRGHEPLGRKSILNHPGAAGVGHPALYGIGAWVPSGGLRCSAEQGGPWSQARKRRGSARVWNVDVIFSTSTPERGRPPGMQGTGNWQHPAGRVGTRYSSTPHHGGVVLLMIPAQ